MAATYNITLHPLLSDKAKALFNSSTDVFDTVVEAAERTLGLHDTEFAGSDKEDARLAIVLELNYELELTPETDVYQRIDRGERTWQYKANLSDVQPRAQRIAKRLLASLTPDQGGSRSSSTVSVGNSYTW